ncbi:hypothetical protein C9J12_17020 [Photobacterium frigidiphilum]|uniref:Uncharacterized protein n=1 Tax=Photobacterium frigidiphilum TaxID=264736 RepID=A0A2T3JDG2_9GAMM|nr:hypothetical protein [Photobacterium frigidiphilum]PSU46910.1 hypothetical protein C9J12_17020 [Photobacterium frigidiphilum]
MFEKKTLQLLQLFYRETGRVRLLDIDALPELDTEQQQLMLQWLETKRNFTIADVTAQHWIKTCSAGYITEVILHSDGRLEEYTLFTRMKTVGSWKLDDGVIELTITKGDNDYKCSIIANRNVNIHSAIEYKNNELHSYLKLAQTLPLSV